MANTAQARKRVRQAVKARDRNVAQKSNFRTCIKKVFKSLADKNKEESNSNFKEILETKNDLIPSKPFFGISSKNYQIVQIHKNVETYIN